MAQLKNTTINDTGFLKLPAGTTAQRPPVPTVSATGLFGSITISSEGQQLFVPGLWERYQNLPNYLRGILTTTSINDSDAVSVTFSHPVLVYMLRNPAWNAVDTTDWTTVETGKNYITNSGNTISVFSRTFQAGTFTLDNNSAIYMFDFVAAGSTENLGTLRFNTDTQEPEYFNGSIWVSSYGRTPTSAATSAQQLFNLGIRKSGVYWIRPTGQPTAFKHYCDFTQGLGWMQVYKYTSGTPTDAWTAWNGTGANTSDDSNMNPQDGGLFVSPFISTIWSTIAPTQARVDVCDNGSITNFINFNSAGTTKIDWFTQARIQQTSFSGITGGTYNFFGIQGDNVSIRRWFINRTYGGCDIDTGYLCVVNRGVGGCAWETDNFNHVLSDEFTPGRPLTYSTVNLNRHYNRRGSLQVYVR
jgi:hypothetical protein